VCGLGPQSTKRRHQTPEWTILSHINCFIQGEVIGFQVLLDSLHPHSTRDVLALQYEGEPILHITKNETTCSCNQQQIDDYDTIQHDNVMITEISVD